MEAHSKEIIFISGIDGFSGAHLEREMTKHGFTVFGSTFSEPIKKNHFKCNILNKNELRTILDNVKPDYLIHLAAISFVASENIPLMYETNILGTLNVLDVLIEQKIKPKKIIVASSAAVYGKIGNELSEEMQPKPINHYGNSKLAMENMVSNYFDKLNIVITRPFNYTGVGQESHFLVPKIISHFQTKKAVIELGNLDTFREYNDVRFVSQIYINLLASTFKSGVVNISSGKTHSISEILHTMERIASHSIEVKVNDKFVRKNEIKELKGSTSKLKTIINKEIISITLKDTLKEMYLN